MHPHLKRVLRRFFDAVVYLACALAILFFPFRCIRKALSRGSLNSIWAGTPIINMAINAKAERLLGVNARSLVYTTYYITDGFDHDLTRWTSIPELCIFLSVNSA
jgi:hypothetical protein